MEPLRKPFQGVFNIVRFNWHFYVLAAVMVVLLIISNQYLPEYLRVLNAIVILFIVSTTIISLLVSLYIYDLSGLYKLDWLNELNIQSGSKIININAGFDETSALLKRKFSGANLLVYDFYDPLKHTEISIKRAREAYSLFDGTMQINTSLIPLPDNYIDNIFLIFSAHEIREKEERKSFFYELRRVLKPEGKIILVEHLRDIPNFLAYNIGFFHFISVEEWRRTFEAAGLSIFVTENFTPFITKFILEKNGD
jgi:ubiquinone/menaquinone biosynthesis C-methylase UbiE